jgi:inhibitor of KinA sporulation pathway (predicted exonuclease)
MNKGIKHLWIDTETMSFEQTQPDIIQLAGIYEVDGEIKDKFNYWIRPARLDCLEPGIWDFHKEHLGLTKKDIMNFPDQNEVFLDFSRRISSYVDSRDKTDRLIMSGYNVAFDRNKINSWFLHNGDNYLFARIAGRMLDVYHILAFLLDDLNLPSFKLENVWKYMVKNGIVKQIEGNNHSAITDIKQTYILYKKLCIPAREAYINSL